MVQAGAIRPGQHVIIIDDILASGATTLGLAYTVEAGRTGGRHRDVGGADHEVRSSDAGS